MARFRRFLSAVPLILLLCACSDSPGPGSGPDTAKQNHRLPEPVSAQSAFQKMFVFARGWASDVQPLRLAEIDVDEVKAEGGKAGAWEALFVSQSQGRVRRFTYSVINRPVRNLRGGVNSDPAEAWIPSGSEPFSVLALKADSTAAYEVAMKKGREYARKYPKLPVKFLLEKTRRFPDPAWRVFWGESVSTSSYSIFVDATTGAYLATGR